MSDFKAVIKPHYYNSTEYEPIDVIRDWLEGNENYDGWKGFLAGQVLKYLSRAGKKADFQQDVEKAHFYMTMLIGKEPRTYLLEETTTTQSVIDEQPFIYPTKETQAAIKEVESGLTRQEVYADFETLENNVIDWAFKHGLENSMPSVQLGKVMEEVGELAEGVNKDNMELTIDAFGDVLVTLIILALQLDLSLVECLEVAWNEIKDRNITVDSKGMGIKEEDL